MSNNKRDQQLGIRFTTKERETIEKHAKSRDKSIAEAIRDAIFSYLSQNNIGDIGIEFLNRKIRNIERALEVLSENLKQIKKEIEVYEIEQLKKTLKEDEKID
jgi:hypothetical protein